MFRLISYLLLMVVLITIVRNVIGLVMRFFANAVQSSAAHSKRQGDMTVPVQACPLLES